MMPEQIIFILSTSRTGTKSLAEGLAGGEVCSPHQPPYSRRLTIAGNFYMQGWLPFPALKRLVYQLRYPQIEQADCRYYVQVFSMDYWPAKLISEQLPNVSIIHIVRDPRTFVPSYLNWMHTRAKSFIANKLVPGWHPLGPLVDEINWSTWWQWGEFGQVCWQWRFKNQLIEDLFAADERYVQVRFEDLFLNENVALLKETLEKAQLPFEARFANLLKRSKNTSRKTYCPPWAELSAEQQEQLLTICGSQMEAYGYLP